jgi:hypothetical protein
MTELGRLSGVFFEPSKAFADVAERPRWIVPIVIAIVFALTFSYAMSTHVGWEATVRQSMVNNPRVADLPADQREQIIEKGAKAASILGWVGAIVGPPFFTLVIAAVLTGIFNGMLGTELKFKQMFAITAYAFLARAIYTVLLVIILYLKPPEDFDIRVSPFSLGAYLNRQETPKWLLSLAGSLDLFTIWVLILLAIGFSVAAKKLSFAKALITICIPWLVLVVAGMVLQSFQ